MSYFDYSKSYEKVIKIEKNIVQNLRNRKTLSNQSESLIKVIPFITQKTLILE